MYHVIAGRVLFGLGNKVLRKLVPFGRCNVQRNVQLSADLPQRTRNVIAIADVRYLYVG